MILGERELQWQQRITAEAVRHGWTVYAQQPAKRSVRQGMPGLMLARPGRVLAVYPRTRVRRDRTPPAADWAERTGVPAVVWSPEHWPEIVATLIAR